MADTMTDKKVPSPAEASREGLRQLEDGKPHHDTTAHTTPPHPSGATFDETASETHRGTAAHDHKK